ncbi:dTDP-4-dehydrorhamnose 3,5-epimerase [Nitrospira sp. KM1]|uniref:dTDP-4-dehydrorhamnose 3,5-epimerase n=1 Tax=Nitrospira sp. KM1 TaxID=1936990 RepID=UPI0013A72106|nr:dTDP-4-dehydrorhamnose 3,5-epimerase [Nitrospira sp. KM1]BCA54135.1 dTDP-4-dehydrorhamnose 3,5-epimerase [Nitrospira sp. KM1]
MKFTETSIQGAFLIEPVRMVDERGYFARTFCVDEFGQHGIDVRWLQASVSYNEKKGTLRGMHFQLAPHEEVKLVQCIRGAIYDVILDLRPSSLTFRQHVAAELSADNGLMFLIPKGCAHGFQTLEARSEVFYHMSVLYSPEQARGVRWNDPCFGIAWPSDTRTISTRDQSYPDFHA